MQTPRNSMKENNIMCTLNLQSLHAACSALPEKYNVHCDIPLALKVIGCFLGV